MGKKMTNGGWIRSLTDEELAEFLDHAIEFPCDGCCNNLSWCLRNNAPEPICKRHYLDWLMEERKN